MESRRVFFVAHMGWIQYNMGWIHIRSRKWYNSVLDGHLDFFAAARHPVEQGLSDGLGGLLRLGILRFFLPTVLARVGTEPMTTCTTCKNAMQWNNEHDEFCFHSWFWPSIFDFMLRRYAQINFCPFLSLLGEELLPASACGLSAVQDCGSGILTVWIFRNRNLDKNRKM